MSKSVGRLSILLIEGKDFFSFDGPNKTSDPYVEFRAGQFKHVSKAATKTLTPLWKEKFELDYEGDSDNIYFFVYDKNILSSPFYGVAHYPIACLDRLPWTKMANLTLTLKWHLTNIPILLV
jgi:Ca2+-dependent lipid-binding protein